MNMRHTLLGQPPPLMQLELFPVPGGGDGGVAPGPGEGELHGLVEELEALDLLDGLERCLGLVEDDEGLPLRLQVGLGHDVDDVAVLGKHGRQRLLERVGFHALLQIAHVYSVLP